MGKYNDWFKLYYGAKWKDLHLRFKQETDDGIRELNSRIYIALEWYLNYKLDMMPSVSAIRDKCKSMSDTEKSEFKDYIARIGRVLEE